MTPTGRFEGQSDFSVFLRTGLRFRHQAGTDVEVKFNPWHDPDDGRFTFAGQGTNFGGGKAPTSGGATQSYRQRTGQAGGGRGGGGGSGWRADRKSDSKRPKSAGWGDGGFRGGGGGSFGGGGASAGFWEYPEERKARLAREAQTRSSRVPSGSASLATAKVATRPIAPRVHTTVKNGYRYDYNRSAQVVAVDADLRLEQGWRSRKNQSKAGGGDRRPTDHGGHYIAVRFDGSHSKLNHFAQDANFNQGAYRALEDKWAAALREGKKVHVLIAPRYHGSSKRPYKFEVDWYVNGRHRGQVFYNEKGGKSDGR